MLGNIEISLGVIFQDNSLRRAAGPVGSGYPLAVAVTPANGKGVTVGRAAAGLGISCNSCPNGKALDTIAYLFYGDLPSAVVSSKCLDGTARHKNKNKKELVYLGHRQ